MQKIFICNNCGEKFPKWKGKCSNCFEWNSVSEETVKNSSYGITQTNRNGEVQLGLTGGNAINLKKFNEFDKNTYSSIRINTKINELDQVLGGGIVVGSAILIGGEPGIGKSTLLIQIINQLDTINTLYVTAEESCAQVSLRAQRLKMSNFQNASLISTSSLEDIIATIEKNNKFQLLIIDSIQTIATNQISSIPGSISQVKAVSNILINYCKNHNISLIIVGHITKDGQIAGPKILEHMVDCVLYFETDNEYKFRILRAIKNRFGSVNELGIFEMMDYGLQEISNPSEMLIANQSFTSGSVIFAGVEGVRPILNEIQSLVIKSFLPVPRRYVIGWDANRLSMIIAVLEKRCNIRLANCDIYLTVAGGLRIQEPAADLAVAAAILSTFWQKPIPKHTAFFGEINLSGDIRQVNKSNERIKECQKMNISNILCPKSNKQKNCITNINQLKNFFISIEQEEKEKKSNNMEGIDDFA